MSASKTQVVADNKDTVNWTWTSVLSPGDGYYRLEGATSAAGPFQAVTTADTFTIFIPTTFSQAGTFYFRLVAHRNCGAETVSNNVVMITANASCTSLTLSPATPLPGGVVGTAYSQTILASGGAAPYGMSVSSGSLPPGLSLSSTGVISGTPTTTGTSNFTITATDSLGCTGSATYSITISASCNAPLAPINLSITAKGEPAGAVPSGTDFLTLAWQAALTGTPPMQYQYRVNGDSLTPVDPLTPVTATSADAPPHGCDVNGVCGKNTDPITLFVYALACSPLVMSPLASFTPLVPPAPPSASFSIDKPTVAPNTNVTLTDGSSPQATSWLWVFSGGLAPMTAQSPTTVQFPAPGSYQVALIASNGAGSSVSGLQTITVTSASSLAPAPAVSLSRFDPAEDRLVLGRAELGGEGRTYVLVRNLSVDEEAVAFLRAVDKDGRLVVERRLVIPANDEAIYDAAAWGLEGQLRLELVSTTPVTAYLQTETAPSPKGPQLQQKR